jgi:quercetin dioxygenase-like cupin family protein
LWGDEIAGEVADWIYVSSSKIHMLVFGLPVGGAFRHSNDFRTIFAADEVLYVLEGEMAICNPSTGEVHLAKRGEAVFFQRDTWHHCFNVSADPLRVLEFFAPPPAQGTSGAYAKTQPLLETNRYAQDQWLGHWPKSQAAAQDAFTMRVLREADTLWRLEGHCQELLVGILASTKELTVGSLDLRPGKRGDVEVHDGDEALYILDGSLNVRLLDTDGQSWFELKPKDGFYLPAGTPHQYYNISGQPVRALFAVAPRYLPS